MSDRGDGTVDIHGKIYKTVALRVREFRDANPLWGISTDVLSAAEIVQIKATVTDEEGRVVATGLAEEVRGSTNINKTSALENAETSAVGRALAFLGLGGTEIRSAEEMANAVVQQQELRQVNELLAHNKAVREHIESVVAVKTYLLNNEYENAVEALSELPEEDRNSLWRAPSKGGIFTTGERKQMQSDEWSAARRQYHGIADTGE